MESRKAPETFEYSRWRHGGWYVHNVRYPSGAIGCVSRNYEDRKWRIACDPRPFEEQPTFRNRDEAARAEWELAEERRIATERTFARLDTGEIDVEQAVAELTDADTFELTARAMIRHHLKEAA